MKKCKKCEVEKPLSEFSLEGKTRSDGTRPPRSKCKPCRQIEFKEYRERDIEKIRAIERAKVRRYGERHPERVKAANRASYRKHREKRLAANRRWEKNNPGQRRILTRRWAARNKARKAELARQYIARKLDAFVAEVDETEILIRDLGICGICTKPIMESFQIDHVIPLAANGTHEPNNVQLAHPACNQSKGNRT